MGRKAKIPAEIKVKYAKLCFDGKVYYNDIKLLGVFM